MRSMEVSAGLWREDLEGPGGPWRALPPWSSRDLKHFQALWKGLEVPINICGIGNRLIMCDTRERLCWVCPMG